MLWNKCCELDHDVTLPHLSLTPSIFIMLQLLPIIVITMPLSVHEKSWHVDHVLARAITHCRTQRLPVHPEPIEGQSVKVKGAGGEGGKERSWLRWEALAESSPRMPSWSRCLLSSLRIMGKRGRQLIMANEVELACLRQDWQWLLMLCEHNSGHLWWNCVILSACELFDHWHHSDGG